MTLNEYIAALQAVAAEHPQNGNFTVVAGGEDGDIPYYQEVNAVGSVQIAEYGDSTTTQWSYKKDFVFVIGG